MAKARVPSVSDHRTLSALPAVLMNTHSGTAIHTDSPGFLRLRASREVCVPEGSGQLSVGRRESLTK